MEIRHFNLKLCLECRNFERKNPSAAIQLTFSMLSLCYAHWNNFKMNWEIPLRPHEFKSVLQLKTFKGELHYFIWFCFHFWSISVFHIRNEHKRRKFRHRRRRIFMHISTKLLDLRMPFVVSRNKNTKRT